MSFLIEILRPTAAAEGTSWFNTLKRAGGGCNDLVYSGHMFIAVLTAMAWTVCTFIYYFHTCLTSEAEVAKQFGMLRTGDCYITDVTQCSVTVFL